MMGDLESDLVERKESLRGDTPVEIRQAVCAFANDLPDHRRPGVVFVGARDDGQPAAATVTDELLLQLAAVALIRPRQPGKTTLARGLAEAARTICARTGRSSSIPAWSATPMGGGVQAIGLTAMGDKLAGLQGGGDVARP